MTIRNLVFVSILVTATQLAGCDRAPTQRAPVKFASTLDRPNVLLIVLDDVGRESIGAYRNGGEAVVPVASAPASRPVSRGAQTPNIDRLAAEGIRFTRAYSNPVCSPTRATLVTGRYCFRTGIGTIVHPTHQAYGLPLSEPMLPRLLGAVNYDTSQLGKWHLGSASVGGPDHPRQCGWAWSAGTPGNIGGTPGNLDGKPQTYWHWEKQTNGVMSWRDTYLTTETTDDALARIAAMHQPWMVWLSYNAAHAPWHVPPANMHTLDVAKAGESDELKYQAMVESLDYEVGRMMSTVDPAVLSHTVIILLGDNGASAEVSSTLPFNKSKGTLKESAIDVPFIISGAGIPEGIRGSVSSSLVNTVDVYATILDLAGAKPPADCVIDGVSLRPLLSDPTATVRKYAYAERFAENSPPMGRYPGHSFMLTDGRYKLLERVSESILIFDTSLGDRELDGERIFRSDIDHADETAREKGGEVLDVYTRMTDELKHIWGPQYVGPLPTTTSAPSP